MTTFRTRCCAKSRNATVCGVPIAGRTVGAARRARFCRSITSGLGRVAVKKQLATCGCFAPRTINCSRSETLGRERWSRCERVRNLDVRVVVDGLLGQGRIDDPVLEDCLAFEAALFEHAGGGWIVQGAGERSSADVCPRIRRSPGRRRHSPVSGRSSSRSWKADCQ